MKKTFGQRQIPTFIGLVILVVSLIGGIALIGQGGGVFAPRAAPQTTPKNVKITNVKDTSVTVSFITDEATTGFIKYGTEPESLKFQASDDRDQVTGSVAPYSTHYITIRDLKADTTYYFTLGTGSNSKYDNNGSPYVVKTAKRLGTPPSSKTLYGTIQTSAGSPATGVIVYLNINGASPLSSLTKDSGSWAIPLSNARTLDGSQYATINATDDVQVMVQGTTATDVTTLVVKVEEAQPVPPITLGSSSRPTESTMSMASESENTTSETPTETGAEVATQNPDDTTSNTTETTTEVAASPTPAASPTEQLSDETTVDLTAAEPQVVTTTQPVITGEAPPSIRLSIEIHSETQINTAVTTDSQGKYTIDLEALKKELEPGEHTVTITYTDPTTGKLVMETKTFTVAAPESSSTLLAAASPKPFGTGNPFTIASPTPSPSPSTTTASASPRVSVPASSSGSMVAGSVETTFALLLGGFFFVVAGIWTYLHNVKIYSSE